MNISYETRHSWKTKFHLANWNSFVLVSQLATSLMLFLIAIIAQSDIIVRAIYIRGTLLAVITDRNLIKMLHSIEHIDGIITVKASSFKVSNSNCTMYTGRTYISVIVDIGCRQLVIPECCRRECNHACII